MKRENIPCITPYSGHDVPFNEPMVSFGEWKKPGGYMTVVRERLTADACAALWHCKYLNWYGRHAHI